MFVFVLLLFDGVRKACCWWIFNSEGGVVSGACAEHMVVINDETCVLCFGVIFGDYISMNLNATEVAIV